MRFRYICIAIVSLLLGMFFIPQPAHAKGEDVTPGAKSAILMDAGTGSILYAKNSHAKLAPASVTKVMTMLLVMEALDKKQLTLDEKVRVSEKAASMGGTQIFLKEEEQMSVRDLLKGIAIISANDAAVAIAEHLAGSEERFVARMNQRMQQLGGHDTHFQNTNGLPVTNHYTSAHDIALMSRELLKHQNIIQFTGLYEDYLRKSSSKPFWLVNTNKLLKLYPGVDGLKTGFTQEAKYCLTATAKKGTQRTIAVVMGEPDIKTRNKEIMYMLDQSFQNYQSLKLYEKGELITQKKLRKSEVDQLSFFAQEDLHILLKKRESTGNINRSVRWLKNTAPISKGERVGQMLIRKNGNIIQIIDLLSNHDIAKAGIWSSFKSAVKEFLLLER